MIMERKLISKHDVLILIIIAASAATLLLGVKFASSSANGLVAVITVDGAVVREVNLDRVTGEETYELSNGIIIATEEHQIWFEESNCKDKICVSSGKLSKAGDVAACVPNKTVIHIEGSDSVDIITY